MPDTTIDPNANREYILLPQRGLRAPTGDPANLALRSLPQATSTGPRMTATVPSAGDAELEVIDTVSEDGPKLVAMNDVSAARFRSSQDSLRLVPVIYYQRQVSQMTALAGPLAAGQTVTFKTTSAADGSPLAGAAVVAFTDFALRFGAQGITDANGVVKLVFQNTVTTLERVYVYPPNGFWGAYRAALPLTMPINLALTPLDLQFTDCLRHFYGASTFDAGANVVVGVLDSGVDAHPDLNLVGGRNTVTGEPAGDYGPTDGHGTHVAGIIGANGAPPNGLRGVAPGVDLRSYRVFGHGSDGASNYAIAKAMILAAADGCDILNLSLGGAVPDDVTREAVTDARNNGILVVVAAGNDDRSPVSFPAAYSDSIAVSAMGRVGTFPTGSLETADIANPKGTDPNDFLAGFSNIGVQIDVTGPGVGILSTLPGGAHGPMGGTSMACPAVSGAIACLLSQDATIASMVRDRTRSDAIATLLRSSASRLGFGGIQYEGVGLPRC